MKHTILNLILLIIFLSETGVAQNTTESKDHQDILRAIETMFDAMRESDSTKLKTVFHKDLEMYSSSERNGTVMLQKGSTQSFITAVGTKKEDLWDERIDEVTIKFDDNLAQAWMNYYFYLNDQFLHCGINFMLFSKSDKGWQLLHIADTRKKNKCVVPEHLK